MTTRLRKHQALLRENALQSDGKIKRKCKVCTAIFYSHRMNAQTCSARCRQRWHRNARDELKLIHWHLSHRTDQKVRVLADRHYYRKNPNSPQFTPPGKCVVFRTANYDAFWITNAPFTQYIRHRWAGAWTCIAFRNESPLLSSTLITQAVAASLFVLRTPPALGFITFVNASKIKSPNPGYCFKRAGWEHIGFTKGALHVLQLLPEAFPTPIAPITR